MRLRNLTVAIVCGIIIALATGLFENMPGASIIGAKYYGFPLYWRVTMVLISPKDKYVFTSLALDIVFWFLISIIALYVSGKRFKTTPPSTTQEQSEIITRQYNISETH